MKDFYFPHTVNAANDEKILKLRAKFGNTDAYGMWWMLLEHLARNNGLLDSPANGEANTLAIAYGIEATKWVQFIEYCEWVGLLKKGGGGYLFSPRMSEHLKMQKSFSDFGKEGAKKRWASQDQANGGAIREPIRGANDPANSKRGEERRREDMRGNDIKKPTKKAEKTDDVSPKTNQVEESTPIRDRKTDDVIEKEFWNLGSERGWLDKSATEVKANQLHALHADKRLACYRKMRVALNCTYSNAESTKKMAHKVFNETCGLIQDSFLNEKTIDDKELAKRREFALQENGRQYVEQELGVAPPVDNWE